MPSHSPEYRHEYYLKKLPYYKNYYQKNSERLKAYRQDYGVKNHEAILTHHREYYKQNQELIRIKRKQKLLAIKKQLVDLLGGKCKKCGDSDVRHLVFHHRNGGGNNDRVGLHREIYYRKLIDSPEKRAELDLFCANCHSELHV